MTGILSWSLFLWMLLLSPVLAAVAPAPEEPVQEPEASLAGPVIDRLTVVFGLQSGRLTVMEMFTVRNFSESPVPLVFTLPAGADELSLEDPDAMQVEGTTLTDKRPLAPGEQRMYQWSYRLPAGLPYQWSRRVDYPTGSMAVLIPSQQLALRSSVLQHQGETEFEGLELTTYLGMGQPAGGIWHLQLLDPASLQVPIWRRTWVWGAAVTALALISIAYALSRLQAERDRQRSPHGSTGRRATRPQSLRTGAGPSDTAQTGSGSADADEKRERHPVRSRELLLDELTELELQFEKGLLPDAVYQQKRQELWNRLLEIAVGHVGVHDAEERPVDDQPEQVKRS